MQLQATQNLQLLYLSHSWLFLINAHVGQIKTRYLGLCEILKEQCGAINGMGYCSSFRFGLHLIVDNL